MFLAKSTELDPEEPLGWLWRAGLAEEAEQALIWLNRVLDLEPDHPQARRALPRVRMQAAMAVAWAGDFSMSRHLFQLAADSDPSSIIPWLELASMAQTSDEARVSLDEVLRRQPDHAGALKCIEHLDAERRNSTPTPLSTEIPPTSNALHAEPSIDDEPVDRLQPIKFVLPSDQSAPPASRRATVMVIDDNREVRDFVHRHIEAPDVRVLAADGADEALAILRDGRIPDIILLDGAMPGVNGYELCKVLRQNRDLAKVPIVLLERTENWLPNFRGMMSGFTDTLAKPISPSSLRAVVAKHCPFAADSDPSHSSWPELPEEAVR